MSLILVALLTASPPTPERADGAPDVSVDGGAVPTVAPGLTEAVAPLLAPELASDGGQAALVVPESLSVYTVQLPAEAALTAGSLGLYLMVDLIVKPTLQGDLSCRQPMGTGRCNPADLSGFDRYAVGKSSVPWRTFSDVALAGSLVLPVLYLGLESLALPTRHPWGDFANDLLVVSEAISLTLAMQTVMKFAFRRPRPARYLPDAATNAVFDQELSLPSGHSAAVAAATMALTTTVFYRHPDSKVRYLVLGGGILLSSLTALARVESGQHFPTDVITGLMIGWFSGFVVPYLHHKVPEVSPSVAYNPATGATLFTVSGLLSL